MTKLTADDGAAGDCFGFSLALDGGWILIGAWGEGELGTRAGAAYAFPVVGRRVEQAAELLASASDREDGDLFGCSVSISGDQAIVGALGDNNLASDSGSAYAFERDASGTWTRVDKLFASDRAAGDQFGSSVSISADRAIVGAPYDDDLGYGSGSAYLFERSAPGTWTEVVKLTASDGAEFDQFGSALSISGDRAIVGAPYANASGTYSGSAYVFERDALGAWTQVAKLTASDGAAYDYFGGSVSMTADRALVGARQYAYGSGLGSAYVFERDALGSWTQVAKLTASDQAVGDGFGCSVALSGDRALIGACRSPGAGSAYVFERIGGSWTEVVELSASDALPGANFGSSVALSRDRALIGTLEGSSAFPAYLFEPDDCGVWREIAAIEPSDDGGSGSPFQVALSGDRALIGHRNHIHGVISSGSAYAFDFPVQRHLRGPSSPGNGGTRISLSSGGRVTLPLDAGPAHALERYLLLGSASGEAPGVTLRSNLVLPLRPDAYFRFTLSRPNSAWLADSLGVLDEAGRASAVLELPAGSRPTLAGVVLHHAFATFDPLTGAATSTGKTMPVTLVP